MWRSVCDADVRRMFVNTGAKEERGPSCTEKGMNLLFEAKQLGDRLGARNYDAFSKNHNLQGKKLTFSFSSKPNKPK